MCIDVSRLKLEVIIMCSNFKKSNYKKRKKNMGNKRLHGLSKRQRFGNEGMCTLNLDFEIIPPPPINNREYK